MEDTLFGEMHVSPSEQYRIGSSWSVETPQGSNARGRAPDEASAVSVERRHKMVVGLLLMQDERLPTGVRIERPEDDTTGQFSYRKPAASRTELKSSIASFLHRSYFPLRRGDRTKWTDKDLLTALEG
jgi:hypothetical protein